MGKMKISKAKKSRSTKGTSGIPNWLLSTIIIVVVIAVLGVCISTAIFSSGLIGRCSMAMRINDEKNGDITVTQNMMSYYFRSNYISMVSMYAQYLGDSVDPYSIMGIDPTLSLKDQKSPDGKDTMYNYYLNSTMTSVKQYLVYAAAAQAEGITLTDADQLEVDTALENTILNIRYSTGMSSGYSDDACCAIAFGEGVNASDVRDAIELETLASKMSQKRGEEIEAAVKKDTDRINETYDKDNKLFNYVDYLTFSFDVDYDDVVADKYPDKKAENLTADEKAEVLKLYKERIEKARENAKELASKTTVADYNAFIANFIANEEWESIYKTATKDLKEEATKDLSAENLKTIKDTILTKVLAEIAEGKSSANDDTATKDIPASEDGSTAASKEYYIYDIKITKEFRDAIKSYKDKLFSTVYSAIEACNSERVTYVEPSNKDDVTVSTWAFNADRKALDAKSFETGDKGSDIKNDTATSFSAEVVMLTKPSYKVETLSRDFAYLLFTKEESAKAAIEALKKIEDLDKDNFLALASDADNPADAHQFIEDCVIYSMQSDALDEWLFDEDLKEGSYTSTPILMDDESYMVALYVKQNETPEWKYRVIKELVDQDYTAFEENITEKYMKNYDESIAVLAKLEDKGYAY